MRAHRETFLRISSLIALAAGVAACDQPAAKCNIARGKFSAKYTLVPGSVTGTGDCGSFPGEELWVQGFTQPKPGSSRPDPDSIKVGIVSVTETDIKTRAECSGVTSTSVEPPYALGLFTSSKPDSDDFCHVPTLSPSAVTVAEQESAQCDSCFPPLPAEPAHDVRYEWSNVRVYVTAGANGTQFAADLKRSIDGCSAQFKVTALYPSVSCAGFPVVDMNPATGDDAGLEDGGLFADAGLGGMDAATGSDDASTDEDSGEFVPPEGCDPIAPPGPDPIADESLCSQSAPMTGGPSGSNLNPEFMVQCDVQQLRCVLSGDPPSLR